MIQAAAHLPRAFLGPAPGATSKAQHPSAFQAPARPRSSRGAPQKPAELPEVPQVPVPPVPPVPVPPARQTPAQAEQTTGSSAAFRALLSWAGDALGTEYVLFAAPVAKGWSVTVPRYRSTSQGTVSLAEGAGWSPAMATSLRDESLLATLAGLRGPVELSGGALAAFSPDLARAGVLTVLGSPVYAPSGALAGILIAAYRPRRVAEPPAGSARPATSGALAQSEPVVSAGPETIGCIARLLATAHHHLAAYQALEEPPEALARSNARLPAQAEAAGQGTSRVPGVVAPRPYAPEDLLQGGNSGLLLAREVSKVFAVSTRTVANWVNSGMLPATRTAGGHLRFRRGDVAALYERRETGVGARAPDRPPRSR
jgi:excisionase family DNA binding protein